MSQIGSPPLPPPFRGLHSPGIRKHCQIIFACYFRKWSIKTLIWLWLNYVVFMSLQNVSQSKVFKFEFLPPPPPPLSSIAYSWFYVFCFCFCCCCIARDWLLDRPKWTQCYYPSVLNLSISSFSLCVSVSFSPSSLSLLLLSLSPPPPLSLSLSLSLSLTPSLSSPPKNSMRASHREDLFSGRHAYPW